MKTFLFCTSYINNSIGTCTRERYTKWLDFYIGRMAQLGSEYLFLIDDGSPEVDIDERVNILNPDNMPADLKAGVHLVHFEKRLGRQSWEGYHGWWRSFVYALELAKKYDFHKIIHIESDFYVVSRSMTDYLRNTSRGWTAFFSRYYGFPESAIQIICQDSFETFASVSDHMLKNKFKVEQIAETYLPFTSVEEGFFGDRFGEQEVLDGWLKFVETPFKIDYIGQVPPQSTLEAYKQYFELEYDR